MWEALGASQVLRKESLGTSLVAQWLGFLHSQCRGSGN